ncbi:mediator of DNA damage checkpoint protein 1 isoform X2 [Microplitis demolitor]|uniref:mediator of DNA damage checkpoint protein 1 isoform X2 n=1 Tax=Microplitis demolitor TaxID=69319 RepID=UPI0004CCB8AF|nr:mediator of DNA damage checkpoint protein 1 isoform X2 [Microplitis demolitor]
MTKKLVSLKKMSTTFSLTIINYYDLENNSKSPSLNEDVNIIYQKSSSFSIIEIINTSSNNDNSSNEISHSKSHNKRNSILIPCPIPQAGVFKTVITVRNDLISKHDLKSSDKNFNSSLEEKPLIIIDTVKTEVKTENCDDSKGDCLKEKVVIKSENIKEESDIKLENVKDEFNSPKLSKDNITVKSENKRKESEYDDRKSNIIKEVKRENIKTEQKYQSTRIINPNYNHRKKLKKDDKTDVSDSNTNHSDDWPMSSSASTSRSKRHTVYNIMFIDINYAKYEKPLSSIGGKIVSDPSTASILVVDKIYIKINIICAIARGIPIVSILWIESSINKKKIDDPSPFIIKDQAFEEKYKFNLCESLIKAAAEPIFNDYSFIITRNVKPKFSDLTKLIEAAGGLSLINAPKVWKKNTFIVSCDDDLRAARQKKVNSPKNATIPIVTTNFIIDSILRHKIVIKNYLLER